MDRKMIIILGLVIIVAGCIENGSTTPQSSQGLEVTSFQITDQQITSNQRSQIILGLENHHRSEVEFEDISLYRTSFLDISEPTCGQETIDAAEEDYSPSMECRWTVDVDEEDIQGYGSRTVPLGSNINYSTKLENTEELEVELKPFEEIQETNTVSQTYSNNEIEATISFNQPVPIQEGTTAEFEISNVGSGRVASDYEIHVESEIFESDCNRNEESFQGETVEFSCQINPEDGQERTENVFFNISYKYVQSPSVNIEVVE